MKLKFFENGTETPAHECKLLFAFEYWRIVFLKRAITRTRSYGPPSGGCIKLTISYKRNPLVFDWPPVTPGRDSPLSLKKRGDQQPLHACVHFKKNYLFKWLKYTQRAVGCSPLFFKERGPTAKQAGGESTACGVQTLIYITPCLGLCQHEPTPGLPEKKHILNRFYTV